jgi:hypothetical protein
MFHDDDEEELLLSQIITFSSSGEQQQECSRVERSPNLPRMHQEGHLRIMKDYFDDEPVYNDRLFRRRFRMRRSLFLSLADAVAKHDTYFVQRPVSILYSFLILV